MQHAPRVVHCIREIGGLRSLEEELVRRGLNGLHSDQPQSVVEQPLCVATIRDEARANLEAEREDGGIYPRSSYK